MRPIILMVAIALLAACARDPYMARRGGYTPGGTYHHQSVLYPGMVVSQVGA